MLEPLVESIPASFDRVEFRQFRRKVPDIKMLLTFLGSVHARDRTVFDSIGRALTTDMLPEISVVEVPSTVKKHNQLFPKFLLERAKQPNALF